MPVTPATSDISEIARVEQHWTAIWEQAQSDPSLLAAQIARREEYRLMSPYLKQPQPGSRLLDGGCGRGEWTICLTNQGYQVYGVDISRETIGWLSKNFPEYHFLCADIRNLEFSDEFFDAYFSWGVFEHFEDGLGRCVQEAWRVLRPDGFLFISVPFQNWRHIRRDARPLSQWGVGYTPRQGYSVPMRFYQWRLTMPELEQELAIRGFKVIKIYPISLQSGLERTLHHDWGLNQNHRLNFIMSQLLSWVTPRRWFCHMLMAVAQKSNLPGVEKG